MRYFVFTVLGAYMFLLPWDGIFLLEFGLPISPSFVFLGLAVLFYGITVFMRLESTFSVPRFLLPLIILLIYGTLTLIWTQNTGPGLIKIIMIWSYLGTVILVYTIVKQNNISVNGLLWFYITGVLSVGIYSLMVYGFTKGRLALTEDFNPTWFAAFLAWAIIACVNVYFNSKVWGKVTVTGTAVIMIVLLLCTQGRNAIVSLIVSLLIVPVYYLKEINVTRLRTLFSWSSINKFVRGMFFLFFVMVSVSVILYSSGFHELHYIWRLTDLFSGEIDSATAGRITIWQDYYENLLPSLAAGRGVLSAAPDFFEETPHNVFLLVIVEYGVGGLILWLAFLYGLIRDVFKHKTQNISLIWLAFFFPIFGISNDILYYKYWWIGLLLFLLLLVDIKRGEVPGTKGDS